MYHKHLERQIKKYLESEKIKDEKIKKLLVAVSNSYEAYERDRELSEHASLINEKEYQLVNHKLRQLNNDLEKIINDRTKDLEDVAQFPIENPSPILRVNTQGEILFRNPVAMGLKRVLFENKKYTVTNFFNFIVSNIKNSGTIDLIIDNENFIFSYKKIKNKDYYNFYGANITEKLKIQNEAEDNALRLRNFLESTTAIFYIVYNRNKGKNLITDKWNNYFGFSGNDSTNIFRDKSKCILSEAPNKHFSQIQKLKIGETKKLLYQIQNKKTGEKFWLSEVINKQYDKKLKDTLIRGKITDVTSEQNKVMQLAESEMRFRNFMDLTPVMVWVSDENNKVTYSNKESIKFLGYELEKLKDYKQYATLVHPDDRRIAIEEWRKSVRSKKEILSEYRLKSVDGIYHNILEKAIPRFYDDGSFSSNAEYTKDNILKYEKISYTGQFIDKDVSISFSYKNDDTYTVTYHTWDDNSNEIDLTSEYIHKKKETVEELIKISKRYFA